MNQPRIQAGGAVPVDGYLYVARPQDAALADILRERVWFTLSGARTMGKTSLTFHADADGLDFAHVDLSADVGRSCATFREWLVLLGARIASRLRVEPNKIVGAIPDQGAGGPLLMLQTMMTDGVLTHSSGPLAIVLDESDVVNAIPFKEDIIAAFRGLHAERAHNERLQDLVIGFVGLRPFQTYADPLTGAGSPFSEAVVMDDFPSDERTAMSIAQALPDGLRNRAGIIALILERTGGQPLLTMKLAKRCIKHGVRTKGAAATLIAKFQQQLRRRPDDMFTQIERIIFEHRMDSFAALSTYLGLLEGDRRAGQPDAPGAAVLLTSGLVRVRDGKLQVKCEIFRDYFDRAWAERTLSQLGDPDKFYGQTFGARHKQVASEKRICVFNTGGTVGMVQRGDKVEPPESPEEFMSSFSDIQDIATIDFVPLFNLDSINVYPSEWVNIARAIHDRRNDGYAGFVVAHGTDTMAYTASAVAFALGEHLSFPVVFTGAQTTPDVKHGDARINLYRASLAATLDIPEVVICFGDFIFRAVRAQKNDERRFNGFESPVYPPLAHISDRITLDQALVRHAIRVDTEQVRGAPAPGADIELRASFASDVLQIALNPGLEPDFFEQSLDIRTSEGERTCRGVILQTLGAGTVPSRGDLAFVPFIERTVRSGIPVFISTQFPSFGSADSADDRFLPAAAPLAAGGIHVGNMTSATAVVKVRWAIAQVKGETDNNELRTDQARARLVEIMGTDYVGEVDL